MSIIKINVDEDLIEYNSPRRSMLKLLKVLNISLNYETKKIDSVIFYFSNLTNEQINFINKLNYYDKVYLDYKNNQSGIYCISFSNASLKEIINELK